MGKSFVKNIVGVLEIFMWNIMGVLENFSCGMYYGSVANCCRHYCDCTVNFVGCTLGSFLVNS